MGFIVEQGIIRQGVDILEGDKQIGKVTSGTYSSVLKKGVGMCYVPQKNSKIGSVLKVINREKEFELKVGKMPFVSSKYYK